MGIIAINVNTTGLIGDQINPRRCTMITTDNLAKITTAGYLNNQNTLGNQILPTDVFDVLYSFNTSTQLGTYGVFQVSYQSSTGFTLVLWENPGNVLLPVVSGDFAVFNGTTGQIKDAGYSPSNAAKTKVVMASAAVTANGLSVFLDTSGTIGNPSTTVTCGQSLSVTGTVTGSTGLIATTGNVVATAGNLIAGNAAGGNNAIMQLFPTTTSTGSLRWIAAPNGGNYNVDFTNASFGQATVFTVGDPGAATAKPLISGASVVSGNLPKYSGTNGLTVDSGITAASISGAISQIGTLQSVSVTLNTAAVTAAYTTPQQLITNPSAGQMILVLSAQVYTASTGQTPYATGTAPIIQYSSGGTNGAHGLGTIATAAGLADGDITAATSQVKNLFQFATGAKTGLSGLGIYFSNATGNYTAGTGTNVVITLQYVVLTATV